MNFQIKSNIKRIVQFCFARSIIWIQKNTVKSICLTFDDGPHPVYTPMLLDLLDKYNVKSTFFLVGKEIEKHPDIAKEIVQRGHKVGGHSFSHNAELKSGLTSFSCEIEECNKIIERATGQCTKLFRPPWGILSVKLIFYCIVNKIKVVMWSYDSLDYRKEPYNNIFEVREGDIVLMHDDAAYCIDILENEIPRLIEMGFNFDVIKQ